MTIAVSLLSIALIARSVQYIVRVHKSKLLMVNRPTLDRVNNRKVTILIPVFKEEGVIGDAVRFYDNLGSELSVQVYFITTANEGLPGHNPTEFIIRKLQSIHRNIKIIHSPVIGGAKASQLNYAMSILDKHNPADYYGIFDVDSRPDTKGVVAVMRDTDYPDLYQMPSKYTLGPSKTGGYAKATAIFQTRWTLCYEIPKWTLWSANRDSHPLMYVVGHGLFLKSKKHVKFEERAIAEDLELGYRLSNLRYSLKLLPYFDHCTVPEGPLTQLFQSSRWFCGELILLVVYRRQLAEGRIDMLLTLRFLWRLLRVFEWPLIPIAMIMALLYSTQSRDLIAVGLWALSIVIYVVALHDPVRRMVGAGIVIYPILLLRVALNGIGPLYGLLRIASKRFNVLDLDFNKTKR